MGDDRKGSRHRVGLPPVVGHDPKVLILGTMLSAQSYQKQEYYGNPKNQFWRLVHGMFVSSPGAIYKERLSFLNEKRIALWDVLRECDVDGSDDSSIIDPVPNDIASLLRSNTGIAHIFLNGRKAAELFERSILKDWPQGIAVPVLVVLPSSSPANTKTFEDKMAAWKIVRIALEP